MIIIKRIVKPGVLLLTILVILYAAYTAIAICRYGNTDEAVRADAAIVLGAATFGDQPSPVFRERINHGIWLYQNGYVDKIIFTGGKPEGNAHSDAWIARKYAMENAVPSEAIYIEEQSTITQENIAYAARIAGENGMASVIIVSDPLHMRRAMLMAKDYGLTAYSSPTPTTMYRSWDTKLPFLAREVFFHIGYQIAGGLWKIP